MTRVGTLRIEGVRRTASVRANMSVKVGQEFLEWFLHVKRMSEEQINKKVYESDMEALLAHGG